MKDRIIQLVSHSGGLFGLGESGELYRRRVVHGQADESGVLTDYYEWQRLETRPPDNGQRVEMPIGPGYLGCVTFVTGIDAE